MSLIKKIHRKRPIMKSLNLVVSIAIVMFIFSSCTPTPPDVVPETPAPTPTLTPSVVAAVTPVPLTIETDPGTNVLHPGQTIVLSVVSPGWENGVIIWSASPANVGTFFADTGPQVAYQVQPAASNQSNEKLPAEVTITVAGELDRAMGSGNITFEILRETASINNEGFAPTIIPGIISFTGCDREKGIQSCDEIFVISPDGSGEKQLTDNENEDFYSSPEPGGKIIVYSTYALSAFEIWEVNTNGEPNPTRLVSMPGYSLYAPEKSIHGRLVFTAENLDSHGQQGIWVQDATAEPTVIVPESKGGVDPVWFSDGSRIAFASAMNGVNAHFVAQADGTDLRKVVVPEYQGKAIDYLGGRSDVSPDGKWLVFYAGSKGSRTFPGSCKISEIGNREVYMAAIDDQIVYKLTDGGDNVAPSFSPDGEWITFMSYRDGDSEIYVMKVIDQGEVLDMSKRIVSQLTFNDRCDWQPRWGS